jgi:outer membrane protein
MLKIISKQVGLAALLLSSLGLTAQVHAVSQGDWLLRFGGATVNPNDSSDLPGLGVDDGQAIYINATYMIRDNIGLELLAATPFTHDITLNGAKIGETQHLPPTFSVQYHFSPKASFRPYVGAGINYTTFFSEEIDPGVGTSLSLDDSWGLAVQAGFDVDISKDWFFNADIRYIDIETTATISGSTNVDVTIDPTVISLGVGTRF